MICQKLNINLILRPSADGHLLLKRRTRSVLYSAQHQGLSPLAKGELKGDWTMTTF